MRRTYTIIDTVNSTISFQDNLSCFFLDNWEEICWKSSNNKNKRSTCMNSLIARIYPSLPKQSVMCTWHTGWVSGVVMRLVGRSCQVSQELSMFLACWHAGTQEQCRLACLDTPMSPWQVKVDRYSQPRQRQCQLSLGSLLLLLTLLLPESQVNGSIRIYIQNRNKWLCSFLSCWFTSQIYSKLMVKEFDNWFWIILLPTWSLDCFYSTLEAEYLSGGVSGSRHHLWLRHLFD